MIRDNMTIMLLDYLGRFRRPDYLSKYDNRTLAAYYAEALAFHIRTFAGSTKYSVDDMKQMMLDLMSNSFSDFVTKQK